MRYLPLLVLGKFELPWCLVPVDILPCLRRRKGQGVGADSYGLPIFVVQFRNVERETALYTVVRARDV